jgi:hypothetical protein
MARVISLWLAVAMAIGVGIAGAQGTSGSGPKLYSIVGTVKALTPSSLALEVGNREIIVISADSSTRVVAKGTRGSSDLLYRYGRRNITDVVKAGDRVLVTYRRSGRTPYAVEIRVGPKQDPSR